MSFWTGFIGASAGRYALTGGGTPTSAGGAITGNVLGGGVNIITSSVGSALGRSMDAQINFIWPSVRPDASQILAAYYGGNLNANNASIALREVGIPWSVAPDDWAGEPLRTVWKRVVNILQPQLTAEQAVSFRQAGHISFQVYSDYIRRHGLTQQTALDLETWRTPLPLEHCVQQYWLRPENREFWHNEIKRHGYALNDRTQYLTSFGAPYTLPIAFSAFYRGNIDQRTLFDHISANGYPGLVNHEVIRDTMRPIPPPSDLIAFSVREVWDNTVVQRFGYDEEYPFHFDYWMSQQGFKWGQGQVLHNGLQLSNINWPLAYWRSHWVAMSPGQAYAAWHRVRPERLDQLRELIPGIEPFTWEHLNDALKIADYPPAVRKWLAAQSFALPRLIDIRQAYVQEVRDEGWAIDQLRDRGMLPSTARDITALWRSMRERQDSTAVRAVERSAAGKIAREVLQGYRLGLIDRLSAYRRLFALGVAEPSINPLLEAEELRSRREEIMAVVKAIKRDYFDGSVSQAEALSSLVSAGVVPSSATNYVRSWSIQRTFKRRMLTSSEILRYTKEGLIAPEVARQRLLNLGWSNPDAILAVQSATNSLAAAEGRRIVAADRQSVGRAKEIEAVQRKTQSLLRQTQADLRRITPIATLKSWYTKGIVTEGYARARMQAQGYTQEAIDKYIEEWKPQIKSEEASNGEQGSQEPPGNGAGALPGLPEGQGE